MKAKLQIILILVVLPLIAQATVLVIAVVPISGPSAETAIIRSAFGFLAFVVALILTAVTTGVTVIFRKRLGERLFVFCLAPIAVLVLGILAEYVTYRLDPRTDAVPHELHVEIRSSGNPLEIHSVEIYGDGGLAAHRFSDRKIEVSDRPLSTHHLISGAEERWYSVTLSDGVRLKFEVPVPEAPEPMDWSDWKGPVAATQVLPSGYHDPIEPTNFEIEIRFSVTPWRLQK